MYFSLYLSETTSDIHDPIEVIPSKLETPPPQKKKYPKRYEVLLVVATPTPVHFYKLCRAWLSLMMQHHANGVTHVNDVDEYSDNVGDNPHHHYLISM